LDAGDRNRARIPQTMNAKDIEAAASNFSGYAANLTRE
jgi:hypothetical protein